MRAGLVVHPDSGFGAAARIAGTVAARLREHVSHLDLHVGHGPPGEDLDVLVVLGGDGAVHKAVQHCAATGVALGLVPAGNGNDLARALDLPLDPFGALEVLLTALREGRRRRFDLGVTGAGWFATVLCAGFDAAVAQRAAGLRHPRGPRRYDVAVLAELARFRSHPVSVRTEHERFDLAATLVAVGNTAYYGGGVPICPCARPDDGLFDVTVVGAAGRADLVRMLPKLRTGAHLSHPAVRTLRAREVTIDGALPVSADGEALPGAPVTARCVPGALTIVA
ncbi:diacylglycerol kinase (ATP) [Amycolatopsis bartoniae]|uniref:Sphingosine kinase n=1 Tax=Amycolatopsis bartoniae TaxID=941986 RepID=A0A8H9MAV9_9PSEU|nr:diacylglycerol kinase family protein [Amycolatopsis bartoniae]MBB2937011.1 diacylglycerol kinase (ATP) [Amycolatopsis bartoniae]TVT06408.1 diacylglycerol kinase family lipid kinase [Amycolatopsis bartoniae]GHF51814.1 sphingosine kinase [Amycolatopsis bartoniae]